MAEATETVEDVEKASSCLGPSKSSKKRENSLQENDSGITMEGSDSSNDETVKKSKTEEVKVLGDEKATSSFRRRNSSSNRLYRSRTLESSSSSENEEKGPEDLGDSKRPIDLGGGNMVITSASEMDDTSMETSSLDPDNGEPTSPMAAMETGSSTSGANEADPNTDESPAPRRSFRRRPFGLLGGLQSDTDSDDEDRDTPTNNGDSAEAEAKRKVVEEAIEKELNRIKTKPQPKNNWNFVDQIVQRQLGGRARYQQSVLFGQHYYDSVHVPRRLELMSKLKMHRGCVNALSFNTSGTRLASGSDDLNITVWDWAREKTVLSFYSGHRNNVFQSKFMPLSGDTHIVSCARDGQVRLAELSQTGVCKATRRLAKHNGPAHKLSTVLTSPHVVLSAGEDAVVYNIDIRQDSPSKVATVKDIAGNNISLYSIHAHPINENQFCVSGHDQYVRIFDRRCGNSTFPLVKYCPQHLADVENSQKPTVTCAMYSCNGDTVLGSYNDDDIYLFDTSKSEVCDAVHRYSGHRNNATVKGVNFFGPGSRYIVSGSDCGNIFFWDRDTEAIVQCVQGDENGVVNVLEPHPNIPVLATSGLDDDVKIWIPTCEKDPSFTNLWQTVRSNVRKRNKDRNEEFTGLDTQMLMVLWQHIRRTDRRRRRMVAGGGEGNEAESREGNEAESREGNGGGLGDDDSSDDSPQDSDDEEGHRGIQCATH